MDTSPSVFHHFQLFTTDSTHMQNRSKSMNSSKKKQLNLCLTKKTKFYLIFQIKLFPSSKSYFPSSFPSSLKSSFPSSFPSSLKSSYSIFSKFFSKFSSKFFSKFSSSSLRLLRVNRAALAAAM